MRAWTWWKASAHAHAESTIHVFFCTAFQQTGRSQPCGKRRIYEAGHHIGRERTDMEAAHVRNGRARIPQSRADASAKEYHRHHIKPNNMLIQMFLSSAPSHFVSRALFPCIVSHASRYSIGMLMHVTYLLESCVRSLSISVISRGKPTTVNDDSRYSPLMCGIRMAAGKTDRHAVRLRQYANVPLAPDSAIRVH